MKTNLQKNIFLKTIIFLLCLTFFIINLNADNQYDKDIKDKIAQYQQDGTPYKLDANGKLEAYTGSAYKGMTYEQAKTFQEKHDVQIQHDMDQVDKDINGKNNGTGSGSGTITPTKDELEIFVNQNDKIINSGKCEFKCREVKPNYVTQINGYDFASGKTFCSVFTKNDRHELKYNADQENTQCVKQWEKNIKVVYTKDQKVNFKSHITQTPSDKDITLTRFLAGVVTLDPNIINREATKATGQITMADGVTNRSGGTVYGFKLNPSKFEWFSPSPIGFINPNPNEPYKLLNVEGSKSISVADGFIKQIWLIFQIYSKI